MNGPGGWQTQIVVWDVRDPSKEGDPRFWWSAEEVGRLLRVLPASTPSAVKAGTPKGRTLASLRREFGAEVVFELGGLEERLSLDGERETMELPPATHRLSLDPWRDADPQATRVIVTHARRPLPGEEAAFAAERETAPELEELRKEWFAALQSGDPSEPELREQYEQEAEAHGSVMLRKVSPWDPARAVEVSAAVFVQDERPAR